MINGCVGAYGVRTEGAGGREHTAGQRKRTKANVSLSLNDCAQMVLQTILQAVTYLPVTRVDILQLVATVSNRDRS